MLLGRGVNIAPFSVRFEQLDAAAEFAGLKLRGVEHVRIGGWIATSLQNWTSCPATTLQMPANERAAVNHVLAGEVDATDAAARRPFWRMWLAAKAAVDAGLLVVLNPFHQRYLVDVSNETVGWVWKAVLQEFSVDDFPIDRVAFEMVNEPSNYSHARVVGDDWASIVRGWVMQVRSVQPERVLVLTGVQGMRGGGAHSASSLEGLALDLQGGRLVPDECNGKCMVTFHYYEPRAFTTSTPDSPPWVSSEAALRQMASHFARVVNATPAGVGIYLGEYGLATAKVNTTQGIGWLSAVRQTATRHGLAGYTLWTYYGTKNGLVPDMPGSGPLERLCAWDRSVLASAALGLPHFAPSRNASKRCVVLQQAAALPKNVSSTPRNDSTPRACPADGERRPTWADPLIELPPPLRPRAAIVSAALLIDIIAAVFLVATALYCMHLKLCGGREVIEREGTRRLAAVRQTVEFNCSNPPPTVSPPNPTLTPPLPMPSASPASPEQEPLGQAPPTRSPNRKLGVFPRKAGARPKKDREEKSGLCGSEQPAADEPSAVEEVDADL